MGGFFLTGAGATTNHQAELNAFLHVLLATHLDLLEEDTLLAWMTFRWIVAQGHRCRRRTRTYGVHA